MVIIDTSVAYKFFDPDEQEHKIALNILNSHLTGQEVIIIPDLLLYELANAWSTKTRVTDSQINTNLSDMKEYKLTIENVSFELIAEAIEFSREYKISVYDAFYAVLAKKNHCNLITADEKFAGRVNQPFIKKLSDYE